LPQRSQVIRRNHDGKAGQWLLERLGGRRQWVVAVAAPVPLRRHHSDQGLQITPGY